jgi:2-keto-4-pentenoate hydratase/2-oxohepta-3-ene-1,7-dioic acid hydratase in catechol pathway
MKLARFRHAGTTRLGVVLGSELVDLAAAAPELPRETIAFLRQGAPALERAAAVAASARERLPLAAVKLEAPVPDPQKFLGVGLNYADHIAETGQDKPGFPTFFNKQSSCVNAPFEPVVLPPRGGYTDYEGELALVIGRRCRRVPRERAHEVIAGYTIVDDVSVRDWQRRAPTMTLGKSWDTHGPMGPWIVTGDELGDPHALEIRTTVNGELRQSSSTKHMIFDCFALIETLSTVCTLEPGDVISTGTPSGVGVAMKPPRFLAPGDRIRIEISGIGYIEHEVIADPDPVPQL